LASEKATVKKHSYCDQAQFWKQALKPLEFEIKKQQLFLTAKNFCTMPIRQIWLNNKFSSTILFTNLSPFNSVLGIDALEIHTTKLFSPFLYLNLHYSFLYFKSKKTIYSTRNF
jgi:hypothetical protein